MAKKIKIASRSAANQRAYRSRLRERLEPTDRLIDAAVTRALAHISEAVIKGDSTGGKRLLNAVYSDCSRILASEGFDAQISTEALQRRIRFMLKERAHPEASAKERKSWSYPLPSALKRIRGE